jgi:hypothetical protein
MRAIGDLMLSGGCVVLVESLHGETVIVLSGDDAGKTFICVRENESDVIFQEELGMDPRAKRVIRFRSGHIPKIRSQERIQTEDGKIWVAARRSDSGYLTADFDLIEIPNLTKANPPKGPRIIPAAPAPADGGILGVGGEHIQGVGGENIDEVG